MIIMMGGKGGEDHYYQNHTMGTASYQGLALEYEHDR
jgi:hypothetical protein